ncbi:putative phosphoglycerate mutase pmu1 [Taxawa tesnikishii (nom. ined.)]|nr:putative phosphoglycerate mutase pmu1 [Dothideales sp. JES 119]
MAFKALALLALASFSQAKKSTSTSTTHTTTHTAIHTATYATSASATAPLTTTYSIPTAATANPTASAPTVDDGTEHIQYSTVSGYFLQDINTTNASTFDYTAVNFGLINQTYPSDCGSGGNLTQWERFARVLFSLNQEAPASTVYKLLFIGRHGEGYHNAAQTYYGTPAWNCYWSEQSGNSTATWADAHLTVNGIAQALLRLSLTRCLQTANYTYGNLSLPAYYPFRPTVREFFREGISIHTCDRRSNRTYIASTYPNFVIDADLSEDDEIWNGVTSETNSAQDYRSKLALDSVFSSDPSRVISITTHSGEGASLLRVLGHIPFSLSTGAIIPVLVKAETIKSMPSATTTQPWTTSAWCTNGPPVSSETALPYACVCSNGVSPVAATPTVSFGA